MKQFFAGFSGWWRTRAVGHRVILILLIALVAIFAYYLAEGPKPWEEGIAPREAEGKKVQTIHYMVDGLYTGTIIALVIAVLLIPFAGFFGRPLGKNFTLGSAKRPGKIEAILLLIVVLGSMGITCHYALPRFEHSLWGDEEVSMRRAIVGDFLRETERDGKMRADRFGQPGRRPLGWEETFWFYESPNNHMLFSATARLAHTMFPPELDPEKPYFNSAALRLPSLVAALLTLAVLAVLLSQMGLRIAAFALPPLLALHPWFIRYASEARGYGMAFLFLSLVLLSFWKASTTGRWRWFAGFGLFQFLLLCTNLVSLWFLVAINLAAALGCLTLKDLKADRWTLLGRFFLTNSIAGMAAFIVLSPLKLQLNFRTDGELNVGIELFKDMGSAFLNGMRWETWSENLDYLVSGERMMAAHPILFGGAMLGILALLVLGIVALARRGGRHALLILVFLLPVPLFLGFTYWKKVTLYYWYEVSMLPLFWAMIAIGIGFVAQLIGRRDRSKETLAGAVLIVLSCGVFWWVGNGQRQMQIEYPLEWSLKSVKATRTVIDPFDPRYEDVITIGFHKEMRAYDPCLFRILKGEEMRRILEKADAEGKPLYANYALPDFARDHKPEIMGYIDDRDLFERPIEFYAMEPTATRYVSKYKPGSLAAKDANNANNADGADQTDDS